LISDIVSFNQQPVKVIAKGNDVVSPTPVPPEAKATGAVVVENKKEQESNKDVEKSPVEDNKAPGETKEKSKPQPKGEAVRPKPPTVVVKYPSGKKVVTVPSEKIKPVEVEPTEPVELTENVDLKSKTIKDKLDEQDHINEKES